MKGFNELVKFSLKIPIVLSCGILFAKERNADSQSRFICHDLSYQIKILPF